MLSANVVFYSALFFLLGVTLSSAGFSFSILVVTVLFILFFLGIWTHNKVPFLRNVRRSVWLWCGVLSLFIPIGALYYTFDNRQLHAVVLPSESEMEFLGRVTNETLVRDRGREVVVNLILPHNGKILFTVPRYPRVHYGDVLLIKGNVEIPAENSYANYLAVRRINAVSRFPTISVQREGNVSLMRSLLQFKERALEILGRVLPHREAALAQGLTFGERGDFSEQFQDAMKNSGTTHLVALSGYNITIIVWAAMSFLLLLLPRRFAFLSTTILIVGFVFMTGASASLVRAAIMGVLALIAQEFGKLYDIRNAITIAALIMVLINPKILAFDVGFQLSFLALLGLVYVRPVLVKLFVKKEVKGIFAWRENLLSTAAAQLAVLPLLATYFGNVSAVALATNVVVLSLVPLSMGLSFLTIGIGLVSYYGALVLGWALLPFLRIITFTIEFFGRIAPKITIGFGTWGTVVYYICLITIVVYVQRFRISYKASQR